MSSVDIARGGAHLLVGVRADVFHEEVENPGVALQNSEQLQRAVFGLNLGFRRRYRRGRNFGRKVQFGQQLGRTASR